MITKNAYAKINLSLEVTGTREDGYHDIVSVMQLVDLHDTLTFSPSDGEITLDCDHPILAANAKGNLVWRAAHLLRETSKINKGARIELQKNIPLAAGLGGGSSDAAATLLGLTELWGLNLTAGELRNLSILLGSDVSFFLGGPTALVEGKGDRVTPMPPLPPAWVVLVCQPFHIDNKTERLYGTLERPDFTTGIITRQLVAAMRRGEFPTSSLLYNAFERAAYRVFDGLDDVRQTIVKAGGDEVRLSGSGPTLYALFPEAKEGDASALYKSLQKEGLRTFLTRIHEEINS